MSKPAKIVLALVIVIAVTSTAIFLSSKKEPTESSSQSQTQTGGNDNGSLATDVSIKYDGDSFSLSSDSVVVGGTVIVTNNSEKELNFSSDPHPVHTDNSELNAGDIAPGESKTFTLNKVGKWGFHNHLNSSQNGELTVKEKPTN